MISDLLSDGKILFYMTYLSHKFFSSCVTDLSWRAERTQMTRGSEGVEKEIELERARSSALMTIRSGMIEEEWLSEDVSTLSL